MECHSTRKFGESEKSPNGLRLFVARALSIVLLVLFVAPPAYSTDLIRRRASEGKVLILKPVLELPQYTSGPPRKIIDGDKANPDDFPVSFQLKTNQGTCTWFLVGARTLMTAAHCVSNGQSIRIEGKDQKTAYEGHCDQAPYFQSDPSQDWALCCLTKDYPLPRIKDRPTGYEVLNKKSENLKIEQHVVISGFGCARENGPLDNTYRIGLAKITKLPPEVRIDGGKRPNFLEIKKRPSYLCGGDSGGPAFQTFGGTPLFRRVVGINAMTVYTMGLGYGYLSSTSTEAALEFFRNWAEDHDQKICGLDRDVENCRPIPAKWDK